MKAPESFVGLRITDLKTRHNCNLPGGFIVFRLQGPEDTVGKKIIQDYTICSILNRVPSLSECEIISAEDYYGTFVLRVRSPRF